MYQNPFLFRSKLFWLFLLSIIISMLSIDPVECYRGIHQLGAAQAHQAINNAASPDENGNVKTPHNPLVQLAHDNAGISKTNTAVQQSREKRAVVLSALKYADKFISAFDFIYKKMKKSENLLPILRNIQTTLDQLPRGLEDVKKEIHEAHMKTQLYRYERTIKDSFSYINEFATTNSTTSKNQFLEMGDDLKKAVNAILDGLLGVQHFGADILRVYREATECHPRRFLNVTNDARKVLQSAADLLAIYYNISAADEAHVDYWRKVTKEKEGNITRRMHQFEMECRTNTSIIVDTMKKIMISNAEKTNQEVAQLLYDHLSDKFETRLWLVIAYNEGRSKSGHAFSNGFSVAGVGNKNALAFVFDRNELAASEEGEAEIQAISGRLTRKCGATRPPAHRNLSLDNPYDYSYFKCLDNPSPREVDKRLREVGVLKANDSSAIIKSKYNVKICKNPSIHHWEFDWQKNWREHQVKYIAVPRGHRNRPGKYFRLKSQFDETELFDSTGGSSLPGGLAIFRNNNNNGSDHGDALFHWYLGKGNRTFRAMRNGLCLTSAIGVVGSRNKVTLEECDDLREDQQHWTLESIGSIVNLKHPERCLEQFHHPQLSSYSLLIESRCNYGIYQKFKIVY